MKLRILVLALFAFAFAGVAVTAHAKAPKGDKTLTGCLSGPNDEGVYVLQTKTGKVEVGGSDELKNHVGHEIKVTGKLTSGAEIGEKEAGEAHDGAAMGKSEGAQHERSEKREEGRERHLKVSNIQMVSESCSGK